MANRVQFLSLSGNIGSLARTLVVVLGTFGIEATNGDDTIIGGGAREGGGGGGGRRRVRKDVPLYRVMQKLHSESRRNRNGNSL